LFAARILSQLWLKKKVIASWLPIILSFEAGMGIFILLVTGNLIITTPPIAPHYSFLKQQQSQGINISLTQHPYELSKFLVTLTSANSKTSPDIHKLTITLTNSEKNIGPVIVPIEQRFLGGFVFDQELLSPQGVWKIDITAQRPSAYDAVASFAVNYPGEIDFAKAHSQDRSFDRFEMINIFIALLILLTAVFLYRHGDRLNELSGQPQTITSNPTPISLLYDRGAWSVPLVFGLFVLSFLGGRHNVTLFKSDFQILCEKNANQTFFVWHENVPQRAGQATSDIAVPGCMVGNGLGQYHFADIREFLYFIRPVQAQAGLSIEPKEFEAGKPAILVFNIRDFTGQPVGELNLDHDRILHAVVVSEDFSVFSHLHVEDLNPVSEEMIKQGKFPISYVFPKAGKYLVAVDFTVRSKLFVESFFVNVGGLSLQANLQKDFSLSKNFNSYQVALKTSPAKIKSGEEIILQYNIKKADNPVTDLQAYLNSPMHISIIKEDLSKFMHTHGWLPKSGLNKILGTGIHTQHLFLPEKFGPNIESRLTFPGPGAYHIFGEFKHNGKVVPTHFMLKAE